jgi:hypothetical protein
LGKVGTFQYNLRGCTLVTVREPPNLQDRFTVYDVFAVLVPGVVFMYLLAFTLDRAVGVRVFDWTGGFGDAALLLVFGYAAGNLLQALGKALIERPWLWARSGQPTATMLTSGSKKLSEDFKGGVLEALDATYGELSLGEHDKGYRKLLEDRTYRAWKTVAPGDPQAQRFLAETHAMRAFAAAFLILALVTLAGGFFYGDENMTARTHGTLIMAYGVLFVASLWRMEDKAVSFARHVLAAVAEEATKGKGQGERP